MGLCWIQKSVFRKQQCSIGTYIISKYTLELYFVCSAYQHLQIEKVKFKFIIDTNSFSVINYYVWNRMHILIVFKY